MTYYKMVSALSSSPKLVLLNALQQNSWQAQNSVQAKLAVTHPHLLELQGAPAEQLHLMTFLRADGICSAVDGTNIGINRPSSSIQP